MGRAGAWRAHVVGGQLLLLQRRRRRAGGGTVRGRGGWVGRGRCEGRLVGDVLVRERSRGRRLHRLGVVAKRVRWRDGQDGGRGMWVLWMLLMCLLSRMSWSWSCSRSLRFA